MKKNIALLDRFLRILVAVVLVVLFFKDVFSPVLGYVALGLALIFAVTAIIGTCPLYMLLGIDTRQFKESERSA